MPRLHVAAFAIASIAALAAGALPAEGTGARLDVVEAARRATVTVRLPDSDGEDAVVGAGFLDAGTGRVVTNAHVVDGRQSVEIGTADGRTVPAIVVARDEVRDIALLAADLPGVPGLSFSSEPPAVGATVYAVGSPFGLGQTVTRGIVSALDRPIDVVTPFGMIQHDAPLNPGSSGGPVIDEHGAVIGINTAMPDGFRRDVGIAYAIPAAIAVPAIARLAAGESVEPRHIGISARALTPRLAAAVGMKPGVGILVESVEAGSAAAVAGILPADVIVALGPDKLGALRDIAVALDRADPGQPLNAYVIRGTEKLVLRLPPVVAREVASLAEGRVHPRRWIDFDALGLVLSNAGPARVVTVDQRSPAADAGISPGDTIVAVGRTRVASAPGARQVIGAVVTEPFALLLVDAAGATRYVVVDPWSPGLDGDGLGGNMRNPRSASF